MTTPTANPTLVVFTLGVAGDSARHPLLPRSQRPLEAQLREHCLESALAAGRELGCRLVVSTPSTPALASDVEHLRQSRGSFGERLDDTIRRARGNSSGPLLVVGADSPDLSAEHLRAALERLDEEPESTVIGPCADGGFYLLATRRTLDIDLDSIRWCADDTLEALRTALAKVGKKVSLLAVLGDLDRRQDLEAWLAGHRLPRADWRGLLRALRRALADLCRPLFHFEWNAPRPAFVPIPENRPPPARATHHH